MKKIKVEVEIPEDYYEKLLVEARKKVNKTGRHIGVASIINQRIQSSIINEDTGYCPGCNTIDFTSGQLLPVIYSGSDTVTYVCPYCFVDEKRKMNEKKN